MFGLAVRYALLMLWREQLRFLPAVLAVGFSILLMVLQYGVLMGTLSFVSIPIDFCRADLFLASRDVLRIDLGHPIPYDWVSRLMLDPEITEIVCIVIGTRLEPESLGPVVGLTPKLRDQLAEPMTIVVDDSDLGRLALTQGVGETAEISGQRVRVVGLVSGYKSIGGPFICCSRRL